MKGREEILKVHSKNVPLDSDVELNTVARSTPGFSGADLENLINEAAIRAARESHTKISMNDIEFAKDKVIMGSERKSLVINEHERKVTAYHEAGHALVAKLTPGTDPVMVTIIPRGMALGLTMQIPIEDKYMMSRDIIKKTINILLKAVPLKEIIFNEKNHWCR